MNDRQIDLMQAIFDAGEDGLEITPEMDTNPMIYTFGWLESQKVAYSVWHFPAGSTENKRYFATTWIHTIVNPDTGKKATRHTTGDKL